MLNQPLEGLIERVAQATAVDRREIDCMLAVALDGYFVIEPRWEDDAVGYGYVDADGNRVNPGHGGDQLVPHYTSSIDAALGLVERLLPGFDYILEHTNGGLTISCLLGTADPDKRVWGNTIPLAIVAATLRAIQSTKTGDAA